MRQPGKTREKGKSKKKKAPASKRQRRKKAAGRKCKLQKKLNATASKIQKLRSENAAPRLGPSRRLTWEVLSLPPHADGHFHRVCSAIC